MIRRTKSKRESAIESWACKWARAHGVVAAKLKECTGIPDRIFFTPRASGGPLIIEFKRPGERPEGVQPWYLEQLTKAGYEAGWCDDKEGFKEIMRKHGVI